MRRVGIERSEKSRLGLTFRFAQEEHGQSPCRRRTGSRREGRLAPPAALARVRVQRRCPLAARRESSEKSLPGLTFQIAPQEHGQSPCRRRTGSRREGRLAPPAVLARVRVQRRCPLATRRERSEKSRLGLTFRFAQKEHGQSPCRRRTGSRREGRLGPPAALARVRVQRRCPLAALRERSEKSRLGLTFRFAQKEHGQSPCRRRTGSRREGRLAPPAALALSPRAASLPAGRAALDHTAGRAYLRSTAPVLACGSVPPSPVLHP